MEHILRNYKIIQGTKAAALAANTRKRTAREKLARMTVIFCDYQMRYKQGEFDENDEKCESMVADLVDACRFKGGKPEWSNPLLDGKHEGIEGLMDTLLRDDDDGDWGDADAARAAKMPSSAAPPGPDDFTYDVHDVYHGISHARSEDRLLHGKGPKALVKNKRKVEARFHQRDPAYLDVSWPPTTPLEPEPRTGDESDTTYYSGGEVSDWEPK